MYTYLSNDPINWIDSSGLFASVCVNGNNVRIQIPLIFTGPGWNQARMDEMLKGIRDYWSGQFGKYDVRTEAFDATLFLGIGPGTAR